ncbi:MAG: bifunctional phosphopantothenoylcysteine decarboxylase/phosphopantothenate--cysteine ligase CoaBC [Clostridiales bacterium]|nr:bifunctional phosphopantothenoylcysteine decarboxylase/phosphopantothenate--cysteine ligase CoaBC [Clostridiales bacterium]
MLTGKHVVLGVTGGIAAYKACEVVSRLKKLHAEVDVIMTENATKLVAPLTFETLSNRPVAVDTFSRVESWDVKHISLAQKADVFLVAPATANLMAKLAHGIADDMLSTTLLATKAPILLAPAMNTGMWTAQATQDNLQTLLSRGVKTVGPASGFLACGDSGAGRMSEPAEIVEAVCELLTAKQDLLGLKVLVTAGPTVERIDPVRYLTNDSSGKMGYAIAQAALERGAEVTIVSGPVNLPAPQGATVLPVQSTMDLYHTMLKNCPGQDIVIQAAAPADYRVENPADQKIKKQDGETMVLTLVENPDVAKAVGQQKQPGQVLVGFAAETQQVTENAQKKLQKKQLDLIVANDVTAEGAGFGVDTNIVTLITEAGLNPLPKMTKRQVGDKILDEALRIYQQKHS